MIEAPHFAVLLPQSQKTDEKIFRCYSDQLNSSNFLDEPFSLSTDYIKIVKETAVSAYSELHT